MAMRSIFQNDSVMARHLDGDGDDDFDDDDAVSQHEKGTETASNTDSETLASTRDSGSAGGGGGNNGNSRYNTGPKGVRSDAKAFAVSRSTMLDASRAAEEARLRSIGQAQTWKETDARERWVEARLKELSKQRGGDANWKAGLERVDADRYLELVESTRELTVVITPPLDGEGGTTEEDDDVDDEEDRRRGRVEDLLDLLSGVFARYGTRAIQLSAEEAEIDAVACPAILQYRDGGELVGTHMRIDDGLRPLGGGPVDARAVERLLLNLGVLSARDKED